MQTFVPFIDTELTARVLDRQRLGKQRIESQQIMQTLVGDNDGWARHPAVKMWRGHERHLAAYTMVIIKEWMARGYRDTRMPIIAALAERFPATSAAPPPWWGDRDLHDSHLAALLRKDRGHYQAALNLGDATVNRILTDHPSYVWPVA